MTVILNDHDRIRLAPGVRPFLRAPTIVQFGADATRTGMITTPAARELVPVLQGLARPKTLRRAVEAAASVVGPDAARSLIDDLVSYRILVPVRSPAVLTVGHGELAAQVRTGLELAGLEVRAPLRGEALARFVLRQEPTLPLIAVNCAALLDDVNALASNRSGAIVPVTQVDARVFVGPVAAPARSGPGTSSPSTRMARCRCGRRRCRPTPTARAATSGTAPARRAPRRRTAPPSPARRRRCRASPPRSPASPPRST